MEREDILENIESNFHLSKKEADIGLALLEERGKSLGFLRVEKYIESYYPLGFSTAGRKRLYPILGLGCTNFNSDNTKFGLSSIFTCKCRKFSKTNVW